eukprot:TRINITY_DN10947_c0_g1_i4.p1 TRINITY_DN10947_c0_g1~~TRINITY_DN10947_c0_g1_i4.p1  ORF type:complete len:163 (+),score=50.69 TRINITY_DN10947_c0_g1_i4:319-807(+)
MKTSFLLLLLLATAISAKRLAALKQEDESDPHEILMDPEDLALLEEKSASELAQQEDDDIELDLDEDLYLNLIPDKQVDNFADGTLPDLYDDVDDFDLDDDDIYIDTAADEDLQPLAQQDLADTDEDSDEELRPFADELDEAEDVSESDLEDYSNMGDLSLI